MNAKKQYGKGLSGFFVGLLLATAVIAGVLYFLNKSGKSSIKEQPKVEHKTSEPEILVPGSAASSTGAGPASQASSGGTLPPVSSDTKASGTREDAADMPTIGGDSMPDAENHVAGDPNVPDSAADGAPPVTTQTPAERERAAKQAQARREAEKKAAAERAKKRARQNEKRQEASGSGKPTPEQILNNGSVEGARKEAQSEARKKSEEDAERRRAEDALNGISRSESQSSRPAAGAAPAANQSGGKMIIQAGSYNNRQAADAQRSKLSAAGVSASVVEAEVNGQPVYRVQTGTLGSSEAAAVRKKLQQRGINSFARSVK